MNYQEKISLRKWGDFISSWKDRDGYGYEKYMELKENIDRVVPFVKILQVDNIAPKEVLDISTGFGFLPFLCKCHGHSVTTTDVCDMKNQPCADARKALELPESIPFKYDNREFKPLPSFGKKFDIITALSVGGQESWNTSTWAEFFNDACEHLNEEGKIFIRPNKSPSSSKLFDVASSFPQYRINNKDNWVLVCP